MSNNIIIQTKNLTKYYGKSRGIENLTFEVKKGRNRKPYSFQQKGHSKLTFFYFSNKRSCYQCQYRKV